MKILGLVTARGGSKGLPGKNLRVVGGKPMILWTLEAARNSKHISDVLISTDDEAIAAACRGAGFDVPFLRPAELAQDDTPHSAVIYHALEWWIKAGNTQPDYLLLLQPTSPLRTADDIDHAIAFAIEKDANALVSVCEAPAHPYWMKKVSASGELEPFLSGIDMGVRRQDLPAVYVLNGALYLIRTAIWRQYKSFHVEGSLGFVMSKEHSVDVDDALDAAFCDYLLGRSNG